MTEVGIYTHLVSEFHMVLEGYIIVEGYWVDLGLFCIVYTHHLFKCFVCLITGSLGDEYCLEVSTMAIDIRSERCTISFDWHNEIRLSISDTGARSDDLRSFINPYSFRNKRPCSCKKLSIESVLFFLPFPWMISALIEMRAEGLSPGRVAVLVYGLGWDSDIWLRMINVPHMTHRLWAPLSILSLLILSSNLSMDISLELGMFYDLLEGDLEVETTNIFLMLCFSRHILEESCLLILYRVSSDLTRDSRDITRECESNISLWVFLFVKENGYFVSLRERKLIERLDCHRHCRLEGNSVPLESECCNWKVKLGMPWSISPPDDFVEIARLIWRKLHTSFQNSHDIFFDIISTTIWQSPPRTCYELDDADSSYRVEIPPRSAEWYYRSSQKQRSYKKMIAEWALSGTRKNVDESNLHPKYVHQTPREKYHCICSTYEWSR